MNAHHEATNKMQHFKNQAAKQRDKIRGLKNIEIEKQNEEEEQLQNLDVELPVSEKKFLVLVIFQKLTKIINIPKIVLWTVLACHAR